jgi:hypothetical protein
VQQSDDNGGFIGTTASTAHHGTTDGRDPFPVVGIRHVSLARESVQRLLGEATELVFSAFRRYAIANTVSINVEVDLHQR